MHEQRGSSSSRPATLDEIVSREETRHGGKGKAFPTHAARLPGLMNVRNGKHLPTLERPILGDSGMAGMGMKADWRLSRRGGGLLTCRLNLSAGPTQNVRNQETEAHCRMAGMGRNADWSPWKPCDPKVTVNGRTKLKFFDCTVNISSSYPYKGKIF